MKLKELWVKDYKNLKDFSINFEKGDGLTMLIGINGSGKSNIIELLSGIFCDAYASNTYYEIMTDYRIKYTIDSIEYKLENINNRRLFYKSDKKILRKVAQSTDFLPKKIIAVYSGEDERLYKTYFKAFEKTSNWDKSPLLYINKNYWNIAIFSFLFSPKEQVDGNTQTNYNFMKSILGKQDIKEALLFINPNIPYDSEKIDEITLYNAILIHSSTSCYVNEHLEYLALTPDEFRKKYNYLPDKEYVKNGKYYFMPIDNIDSLSSFPYTDIQVFKTLCYSLNNKNKSVFLGVDILTNDFPCSQLSEGEKRLILIRAVLDIVANENSLILFDEPDSHIHESRKKELFDTIQGYTQFGRQIVITSHSPTLVDIAEEKNIALLKPDENNLNVNKPFDREKLCTIKYLTGSRLNAFSDLPILLVEGKSDVHIVEKVIKHFKENDPDFLGVNLAFDIYSIGGTGNIKYWHDRLRQSFEGRPILVCVDYDQGGHSAIKLLELSKEELQENQYKKVGSTYTFYLPRLDGLNSEFGIEDYFSKELMDSLVSEELESVQYKSFASMPKIRDNIKNKCGALDFISNISNDELLRFKPLALLLKTIITDIERAPHANT